jgi:aspartate/tyrosine/aromatic aminotransferase
LPTWQTQFDSVLHNPSSRNFGLYGQRAGAFHLVLNEQDRAIQGNILQQLQFIIRTEYSTPPRTGSTFVKTILGDADLKAQWLTEVSAMSQRLGSVRSALHNGLRGSQLNSDFDHIIQQVMEPEPRIISAPLN